MRRIVGRSCFTTSQPVLHLKLKFRTLSESNPFSLAFKNPWLTFKNRGQKFNRFFDSVSLRYLHEEGEDLKRKPGHENTQPAKVTETKGETTDLTAGLQSSGSTVTPSLQFHIQQSESIVIERKMRCWKRGVTEEKCQKFSLSIYSSFEIG